jgi:hypothetical protein
MGPEDRELMHEKGVTSERGRLAGVHRLVAVKTEPVQVHHPD